VLLTRQAIFDTGLQVSGYTVQYYVDEQVRLSPSELSGRLMETGIEHLASQHPVYIGCHLDDTEALIDLCSPLPRFGLHLVHDPERAADIRDVAWLCAQRDLGLVLSFTDAAHVRSAPLAQADIALLDGDAPESADLSAWAERFKAYKAHPGASGLGTENAFNIARDAGCVRFQGNFLAESSQWEGESIPRGLLSPMAVLARMQKDDVTVQDVEQVVRSDAMLGYRLLRWVNSAYYGLSIEVESIEHAIVYLGVEQLRRWLSLMSMSRLQPTSVELLTMAAIRGRMAELLAPRMRLDQGKAFAAGLFSLLDAITRVPMTTLVEALPLGPDVRRALLGQGGPYAELLHTIREYENGRWEGVQNGPVDGDTLGATYLKAVEWTEVQHLSANG